MTTSYYEVEDSRKKSGEPEPERKTATQNLIDNAINPFRDPPPFKSNRRKAPGRLDF